MRRSIGRRQRKPLTKRSIFWLASALLLAVTVSYLTFVSSFLRKAAIPSGRSSAGVKVGCVAWRQTRSCTPYGVRDIGGDRDCQAWITLQSGYCECENDLTAKRVSCGKYKSFTCEHACNELGEDASEAEPLPRNVTCPATGAHDTGMMSVAAEWLHQKSVLSGSTTYLSSHARSVVRNLDIRAYTLWSQVWEASNVVLNGDLRLPESRTVQRDWVRDGVHIPRTDLLLIREQWQSFIGKAPPYPAETFHGKGIVILAGGLTYMVPAWVNIQMLRRTGCSLPVEMFFPRKEYPTPPLESALANLGVTCRQLPDVGSASRREDPPDNAHAEASLSGFTLKIAALILSQFEEVIFLDSDNVPVADPTPLFHSVEYTSTGALLWPDYWQSSAAPDLAAILDVPHLPSGTFESGQMVFDKARSWQGLMLAAFFNLKSDLYYELFSNFMGKGDKESFAHALQAVNRPFSVIRHPVGSVGEVVRQCQTSGQCRSAFLGNTMTQYSPEGDVMFLHTNLSPKWNLEIPGDFSEYRRRWKLIVPSHTNFIDAFGDIEHDIYLMLVELRCASFLPSYLEAASGMEDAVGTSVGLKGFHPQNPGIDFREAYRWGLPGPYLQFAEVSTLDRLRHFGNTVLKPAWRYCWRIVLNVTQGLTKHRQYFVLTQSR